MLAFSRAHPCGKLLPLLAGLLLASLVAGCASTTGMMASADAGPHSILTFVCSTRDSGPGGVDTMRTDGPAYSLQILSIPPDHHPGQIERPAFGSPDPQHHFMVASTRDLSETEFRNELATDISGRIGSNRDVLLYVHGFNTGFDAARFRLAQIVTDGRFGGIPVLFTWPASNNLLDYEAARESATASRDSLANLLKDLSEIPDIGRIHILAHSLGTWLTMEALRQRAIAGSPSLNGKLGLVMLAAPDIDLSVFRSQLSELDASHFSVLVSADDRALSLSRTLAGDRPRVGALDPRKPSDRAALARLGVKIYDLSGKSDGLIDHDAYADLPDVVRSIGAQIGRQRIQDQDVTAVLGERPVDTQVSTAPLQPSSQPVAGAPAGSSTGGNVLPQTPLPGTLPVPASATAH
ncbi:MAG: alpha/beta fold hydrolase [Methylovirgula sp.]|uniref:alpha/beta hydrolase n=1 Tax=Methylovirgula sp. TaxID=1978224 RepID=UPI00307603DA